jgi:hypothetical protein
MEERRVRTWYVVRRRYRRAARIAAVLGALVALAAVVQAVRSQDPAAAYSPGFLVGSAVLVAIGFGLPYLTVIALWRWTRNRHAAEWY